MTKYLLITLIDGKKHQVDLAPLAKQFPINAGKEEYLGVAMATAQSGFVDETLSDKKRMVWVAPSQIRDVEIVFEVLGYSLGAKS